MLTALDHLALEVKSLDRARDLYVGDLSLPTVRDGERELVVGAGETDLILRRPSGLPRGGLHTHFAFAVPDAEYDDWWDRLSGRYDLEEHAFGSSRSLYLYDPDGNCVELGGRGGDGEGITGIFEVVLEVADVDAAEAFYAALGFETVDRGDERPRVRMAGPMDLELWEPHLGLADARGGVHVDLGFVCEEPRAAVDAVREQVSGVESLDDGAVRVRDPDGHYLTFRPDAD